LNIADFDFELPAALIAQEPVASREGSRLAVLDRKRGALQHRKFADLPALLRGGDLLVLNRSRVFPARLHGRRAGGGDAEILLVRKISPTAWRALVRPGRRLRPGDVVEVPPGLSVTILSGPLGDDGHREVRFECEPAEVDSWVSRAGQMPLPPYIRRPPTADDRDRYQTVYARESGSVAAPTAGLHFSEGLLSRVRAGGIETAEVVLHVGPGTFRPVQVEDVRAHRVDPEAFIIPEDTARAIERTRARGGRVVAVGTTTARTLEASAQADGQVRAGEGETDLVIVPGFAFRAIDALITNFHLPRSSLLLLVCAFAGREPVLAAYREAILSSYRFYSYGDAMMLGDDLLQPG
jgi:S-adenosylmethionine:tRNA ribosyltransferase-isomerase